MVCEVIRACKVEMKALPKQAAGEKTGKADTAESTEGKCRQYDKS
jgi:hypothetical protein